MGKDSKGSSMSRRRRLDMDELAVPPVPTERGNVDTVVNLAFCPLLLKYADKGMCSYVACSECRYPLIEYENIETQWLCTTCAEPHKPLPYWGDGKCDGCGRPGWSLMLCAVYFDDESVDHAQR